MKIHRTRTHMFIRCFLLSSDKQTFMDYVMRRRSTVGGALEMFSLPLPFLYTRLILDLTRSLVNRWSPLTHASHCMTTSWPAAATQTRERYFYTRRPPCHNPPYYQSWGHNVMSSQLIITHLLIHC